MRSRRYYVKAARKFLDLVWEEKIYLDQEMNRARLLELLNLEPLQFVNMSKRNFGMTYRTFFRHCRIADIKQILVGLEVEEKKMVEVARQGGYENISSFNIDFKMAENISPIEFHYFHHHFRRITGMSLPEYQKEEVSIYPPPEDEPTFLSNMLNKHVKKLQ